MRQCAYELCLQHPNAARSPQTNSYSKYSLSFSTRALPKFLPPRSILGKSLALPLKACCRAGRVSKCATSLQAIDSLMEGRIMSCLLKTVCLSQSLFRFDKGRASTRPDGMPGTLSPFPVIFVMNAAVSANSNVRSRIEPGRRDTFRQAPSNAEDGSPSPSSRRSPSITM